MATRTQPRLTFVLDRRKHRAQRFASLGAESVSSLKRIRNSLVHARSDTLWISYEEALTETLLKSIDWPTPSLGFALLLHQPTLESLPALSECFDEVAFSLDGGFLPTEQLAAALSAENRRDLFIGGTVDSSSETVTLWRGDLSSLTIPFAACEPSGDGTQPDFASFVATDYGHTIRFGDYEAATDAILYEFDPDFRRREKKERQASQRSFGASLRRLRKQRGLHREDFAPLSAKTIARIEQEKVKRVHSRTLGVIANRLGVSANEIESY